MPGLTVFNRRWMLSSDDLVIPCSIAFGIRTIWLILVVVFFTVDTINLKDFEHSCFKTVRIYFIVYICVLVASAINDVLIAFVSSRGTIYEEVKRKPIPRLLYCRAIVLVWEFCCACVGCYYVIYKIQVCENTYSKWLSEAIVVFNFLTVFICLTMILLSYDSAGNLWYKLEQNNHYNSLDVLQCKREISEKYQKDWMKSCRLLFCCTKKEISKDNVLMFASKLFADYFQRYADLVPSDILAGLILLRQKQKYEESVFVASEVEKENSDYQQARKRRTSKSIRRHQRTPNSTPFNVNNQDEMSLLSEVTYFAKYALACYGWPMYCFLHNIPICCLPGCKLMSKVRCCACCQKLPEHHPPITGDNCCLCNFAAQKVTLDAGNENFVYVNYSSKVFQTPFNVIVDHFKKSIVISCRGTLSLQDVLTDLAIDEERIPDCDPKWTAHKGFLSAAVKVKAIIEEKRLIEKAQTFITDKDSNDYKIVIVGHSLGAGTATLLAFLFKAKYPSLVCYAYGPSGSAVSYEASVYARDFIYSVVLGKDIISRLNLHTIHELQHNILELLRMCHLPKWKILRGCICQCILCGTDSAKPSYVDYFKDNDDMLNIKPYNPENQQKLYMAGKVVHICKIKSVYPRFSRKRSIYQAYWSIPEDFQNILISRLMLEDHFPDALINAMNSILPDDSDDFVTIWSENENGKANANIISPIKKYVHDSHNLLELLDAAVASKMHIVELLAHTSNWL